VCLAVVLGGVLWCLLEHGLMLRCVLGLVLEPVNRELPEQDIQLILVWVFAGSCCGLWKVLKWDLGWIFRQDRCQLELDLDAAWIGS
jgi:hypothetical protein